MNLAATAAQGARIWQEIDPGFAAQLLAAAERAFSAAQANPELFAPPEDTNGGGPYDDTGLEDEFFWAAAELFITTQKPDYKQALKANPLNTRVRSEGVGARGAMSWQQVDTLGRISLATLPNPLQQAGYRAQLARLADSLLRAIKKEGYRLPLTPDEDSGYPWGSNSTVVNNMLVLALAYDFNPRKRAYLEGVQEGMNYLLGRNAMGRSYVTGYGARPVENPHHRFWAHQANAAFPKAPAGMLSGGPNSGLQDPYVKAAGLEGAPQKCFADHIEAWSTNEITINWNAPFFWITAWLDEHAS